MKQIKQILLFITFLLAIGLSSCSKFLEIDPPIDKITADEAFKDSVTVALAANGLYTFNMGSNQAFYAYLPVYTSVMADEAFHTSSNFDELKTNTYNSYSSYIDYYWENFYESIYVSNSFIEQISKTDDAILSKRKREKNRAEALFFRAYSHFVLTMMYGDVPYITTSNVSISSVQGQSTRELVLENIVKDLVEIESILAKDDIPSTYISVHAARALLARIYVYQENWEDAIKVSTLVINESGSELDKLENVFLRSGKEAIFKMSSDNSPNNSYIDYTRFGVFAKSTSYFFLRNELLDAFEAGDLRREKWVVASGSRFHSNKYKLKAKPSDPLLAEEFVFFRLAEQYLLRAEAMINRNTGNDITSAHNDLNMIRKRAGLTELKNLNQEGLRIALRQERRVEFFFEENHRWVDMARWGIIDETLGAMKDKKWKSHAALFPIPQVEIYANVNLIQNKDY